MKRRLVQPLADQLAQGTSPEALAWAVAVGAALGTIPFLGTSTALCALAAALGRLNQPAIQTANYAVSALQVLLIPVFVKTGERLFGLDPVTFDVRRLPGQFWSDTGLFLQQYGRAGLAGAAVWALAAAAAVPGMAFLFRRGFRIMALRLGSPYAGATTPSERNS